jgi:hypothetical protein
MKLRHALCLTLAVGLLAACSKNDDGSSAPPKLMQNQRNALEKAKGVEHTEQQQAQQQQQAVDQQAQ